MNEDTPPGGSIRRFFGVLPAKVEGRRFRAAGLGWFWARCVRVFSI